MAKKTLAVIALAFLAIFAVPAAANAAAYVPTGNVSISGSSTAGSEQIVSFTDGSFTPGETVSFAVTGEGFATSTMTLTGTANAQGGVTFEFTLPADANGSYSITATGATSGNVGAATVTVAAADAGTAVGTDDGLASTGYEAPVLLIWGAAGALLLGIALVLALSIARRQKATA